MNASDRKNADRRIGVSVRTVCAEAGSLRSFLEAMRDREEKICFLDEMESDLEASPEGF